MTQQPFSNGDVLFYDRVLMTIPVGGAHVRECSFFLPRLLGNPVVTATIEGGDGTGGNAMIIDSIVVVVNGSQTEIAIGTVTRNDGKSSLAYYCNLTVIGTPASTTVSLQ